jgi:hypothetical protein
VKSVEAAFVCVMVAACGRDSEKPPAPVAPTSVPSVASLPDKTASACPHTGHWAICNVERRLRQAGFVARRMSGQSPQRPGFSVTPVVYSLARSRLEVFIYADEASLARDIARIDTVTVSPAGVATSWDGTPLLIRSGNLAAVFVGDNPRQADRLTLALTAGAPQPGSPR